MSINSPFNGSTLKMKNKVTRRYYEAHPEKYAQFVYDPDRGCDVNEFYVEMVNDEGEYLLVRENQD